MISDTVKVSDALNAGMSKKRKVTEDLELLGTSLKIMKHDTSSINSAKKIEQTLPVMKECNVIQNVFKDITTAISKTNDISKNLSVSPKKNVTIEKHEYNKNIDKCKNILHKWDEKKAESVNVESRKRNIMLNSISSDTVFNIKENKSHSVESKENNVLMYNNIAQLDKLKELDKSDLALGTCIIDDFNDCFEDEWTMDNQVSFESLQRCTIIDVNREYNRLLLTVKHEDFTSTATVICSGFWKDVKVEKDDIVVIQARKEAQYWVIDNSSGFLVIHPDVLISGTTVVGALFCRRKAVLAEKFRKIESLPYYEGDQTAMVIGSLAHQLLQKAIRQDVHQLSDITKLMDDILQSKDTTHVLYAANITFNECRQKMLIFVPKVFEFIQHYLKDKKQKAISSVKANFEGNITHIHDIEENLWLPKLGIKGKVDVTLNVNINSKPKIMPLEIKTGKPSFSLEHKGQIILYIMMMALTGQDTDTGLLLYLRENIMQEIKSGYPEKRDLILLRNTLASYFIPKITEKSFDSNSKSNLPTLELPEPINHHSACSNCVYNALCCAYLSKDITIQLSESHPLMKLSKQILDKFKPTHFEYIEKWVSLLQLEESAQSSVDIVRYIWTLNPEKREAKKTCICNLKIIGKVIEYDSRFQHTFVRANVNRQDVNIPYMEFTENDYVLVSTNSRVNISAGFILNIREDCVNVLLDRDITKYNNSELFHIDKYSSSSFISFNLANVGGLMGDSEICTKLRDIVIDRKPATFMKGLSQSIVHKSAKIINELNENQQKAVLKAMIANDYILIKGMPGTGKTQTLVALIKLLYEMKCSILITAHTNSAVDNILMKLLDKDIDFLRLGSSVHPSLKHKTEEYVTANCHSPESLKTIYSNKNIVGVTCYGSHHALLGKRMFDVCVVDESTQALQPTVLRPLYSARKFVLVGDPDQLPPIIKSKVARKLGADESLFVRLHNENNTVNLTKQYRMNKNIMQLANKLTYNDALEPGNTVIKNATFNASHSENLIKEAGWIHKVLSQDINDSVILLNTGCTADLKVNLECTDLYPQSDQMYSNIWEAGIILKLLNTLTQMDVKPQNIGVIAPYRAHVALLKKIVLQNIEINTVDQYQGRDKEIIIYSCVKSSTEISDIKEDFEILGDHRRLTVAITRAKHKLIVIGDVHTLSQYSPFKKLFNLIEANNIVNLHESCDDFSWKSIVSILR
ncbi:DNA replication helicase/nuclease 2 isoform X2 [Calliopsis andreniformis]